MLGGTALNEIDGCGTVVGMSESSAGVQNPRAIHTALSTEQCRDGSSIEAVPPAVTR